MADENWAPIDPSIVSFEENQIDGNRVPSEPRIVDVKVEAELTNKVGWPIYRSVGLADVMQERVRQLEKWGDDHDDAHQDGSIAMAAACLAAPRDLYIKHESNSGFDRVVFRDPWPWPNHNHSDHPRIPLRTTATEKQTRTRREQLVTAAALIIAEIDRLDRAEAREKAEEEPADDEG